MLDLYFCYSCVVVGLYCKIWSQCPYTGERKWRHYVQELTKPGDWGSSGRRIVDYQHFQSSFSLGHCTNKKLTLTTYHILSHFGKLQDKIKCGHQLHSHTEQYGVWPIWSSYLNCIYMISKTVWVPACRACRLIKLWWSSYIVVISGYKPTNTGTSVSRML